jgi:hypothetical protein
LNYSVFVIYVTAKNGVASFYPVMPQKADIYRFPLGRDETEVAQPRGRRASTKRYQERYCSFNDYTVLPRLPGHSRSPLRGVFVDDAVVVVASQLHVALRCPPSSLPAPPEKSILYPEYLASPVADTALPRALSAWNPPFHPTTNLSLPSSGKGKSPLLCLQFCIDLFSFRGLRPAQIQRWGNLSSWGLNWIDFDPFVGVLDPKGVSFDWVLSPGAFVSVSDKDALLEAADEELNNYRGSLFLSHNFSASVRLSI